MCCLPLPFDGKCLKTIYIKIKKELPIKSYVVTFANNWNFTQKKKKKRNEENGKSTPMIEGTHLKFLIIYEKKKKIITNWRSQKQAVYGVAVIE